MAIAAVLICSAAATALPLAGQERVTLSASDGAVIVADLYGEGRRGVVLAHGGRFNKDSWVVQAQALVGAGFKVLSLDFRGYGSSVGPGDADPLSAPLHLDVLAAVRYLSAAGATEVSVIGASMGGVAAANAAAGSPPGEIDRVVLLGSGAGHAPGQLRGRKLFLVARDDANAAGPRLPGILADYHQVPEPKEMVVLEGAAHAQHLFRTAEADRVMREILRFLTTP